MGIKVKISWIYSIMKRFLSLEIGPNFELDDGWVALKSIIRLQNITKAKEKARIWFKNRFKTENVWFFDTCRNGIYFILDSLNLPHESEVLVQGFSCIVVPNAVLKAGLKPVVCDVSEMNFNFDLDQIESKITKNTKVWIIQYNFGIVPNMQRVLEICNKHNLILIEDCAHSLGAKFEIKDKTYEVGNFGHAAAFSFGRDKVISTTTGGAVIFNPNSNLNKKIGFKEVISKFETKYSKLNTMSSKETLQNLLYPILTSFLIKPLYQFGIGKLTAVISTKLNLTGKVYTQSEKQAKSTDFPKVRKYSDLLFPLLYNQLNKVEKFNNHRKTIAKIYSDHLKLDFNTNNSYLRFPVNVKSKQNYKNVLKKAKSNGYYLGQWYYRVFLGANRPEEKLYNYKIEDIPNCAKLIDHQTINLPTHINTKPADAKQILEILNQELAKK